MTRNVSVAELYAKLLVKGDVINILISGMTGSGKSALINSLVGVAVAKERDGLDCVTTAVTRYELSNNGVHTCICIWDSPGLQDETDNDEAYIAEMKAKCSNYDQSCFVLLLPANRSLSCGS